MMKNKIIKYLAIFLAISLIVGIINGILELVINIGSLFDFNDSSLTEMSSKYESNIFDLDKIKINLKNSKLELKLSDEKLKVDTNNKNILVSVKDKVLTIEEKGRHISKKSEVILYIPLNSIINNVDIDMGIGSLNIEKLIAYNMNIKLGTGSANINDLSILNDSKFETGAGNFLLLNCNIKNLNLDIGVGEVTLNGNLENAQINSGVGTTKINLINSYEDYQFKIEKGLGNIKINDNNMSNGVYGVGSKIIKIDGGIGNISVNTK